MPKKPFDFSQPFRLLGIRNIWSLPLELSCSSKECSPKLSAHEDKAPKRLGDLRDQSLLLLFCIYEAPFLLEDTLFLEEEIEEDGLEKTLNPLQEGFLPFTIRSFKDCNNSLAFSSSEFEQFDESFKIILAMLR